MDKEIKEYISAKGTLLAALKDQYKQASIKSKETAPDDVSVQREAMYFANYVSWWARDLKGLPEDQNQDRDALWVRLRNIPVARLRNKPTRLSGILAGARLSRDERQRYLAWYRCNHYHEIREGSSLYQVAQRYASEANVIDTT